LSSDNNNADKLFASGDLSEELASTRSDPDSVTYDPLITHTDDLSGDPVNEFLIDQSKAMRIDGDGLIYHSKVFDQDVHLAGEMRASLWLSMNVKDTDLSVSVYEIMADGSSIYLSNSLIRSRYRNSLEKPELIKSGVINNFNFNSFYFHAKTIKKGSRLRLLITPLNTVHWQKNYNSGGVVSEETGEDAKTAVINLHHGAEYPSYLELPIRN